MLRPAEPGSQLQRWMEALAPVVAEARRVLCQRDPALVAAYSGCTQDERGQLRLALLGREYYIAPLEFSVQRVEDGRPADAFVTSLILTYLAMADGTPSSGEWIGFRDLPNGMFYVQAFQNYSGNRLVRELTGGLSAFSRAAQALRGMPLGLGSAAYAFDVLPRLQLAVVYWEGDEDFPAQAQELFERSAPHYMPTDGLAVLGSQLVGQLLRMARAQTSAAGP